VENERLRCRVGRHMGKWLKRGFFVQSKINFFRNLEKCTDRRLWVETGRLPVRGVAAPKLPFSTTAPGASLNASPANWIRVSFERALR
jgi:hypothetical protein